MNGEKIESILRFCLGSDVRVVVRRPNLFQVLVPAYFADRDVVQIFAKPLRSGQLRLTDLGHTRMRLSYTRDVNVEVDDAITDLVESHGFRLDEGRIVFDAYAHELVAGVFGLAQVESAIMTNIPMPKVRRAQDGGFGQKVRELLKESFGDRCDLQVYDRVRDPSADFALDAVIRGKRMTIGVAAVSTNTVAERAVGTQPRAVALVEAPAMGWAVVCQNMDNLAALTRRRLLSTYPLQFPVFEQDRERIPKVINDLADAA